MCKRIQHIVSYVVLMFISSIVWSAGVKTDDYPSKPIRVIVGFSAGGGTDITARLIAQKLSEHFGRPVIVENRTGASGTIAAAKVASSEADGYTLGIAVAGDTIPSAARVNLSYDLLRDFAPVSLTVVAPYVLVVNPKIKATSVKELIELARNQPGQISFASVGVGSTPHFMGEIFSSMSNVSFLHVPFKGATESSVATVNNSVNVNFLSLSIATPYVSSNRLRPIAVTTVKRVQLMPTLPTIAESGLPGYDRSGWTGIIAPAGVRKGIIEKLNAVIVTSLNTAEMKETLEKMGLEARTTTPTGFGLFMQQEFRVNKSVYERLK